ncbi:MAG: hypothetical protein ACLFVO_13505 [Chloroflexaceae bacterium]
MSDEPQPEEQLRAQQRYAELGEKLAELYQIYTAEDDPAERFRLEQRIAQIEAVRATIAQPTAAGDTTAVPEQSATVASKGRQRGLLQTIRAHHQRIMVVGMILGFVSICSALLFAPFGLILVSSLCFGVAGIMYLLHEIEELRGTPGWHLSAYSFAALLIAIGFCGPLYLFFLLARIANAP